MLIQACKKGVDESAGQGPESGVARKIQAEYSPSVWTDSVAFYLDGVSFVYKANPLDQACAPKGRVWWKQSAGLTQGCLAKGSKSGMEGKVANFMVAVTQGKGVLVCERYDKMDGNYFISFIDQHFNTMFEQSCKGLSRLELQDGHPSQNSKTGPWSYGSLPL